MAPLLTNERHAGFFFFPLEHSREECVHSSSTHARAPLPPVSSGGARSIDPMHRPKGGVHLCASP